jgi:hypothetical protein
MGDLSRLEPQEGAGLDDTARKAWAVSQMLERIDVALASHQAHLETFDPNLPAIERAEAADLALFDDSNEAARLQKYEATAERLLYRALREFRQVEAEAAELDASDTTTDNTEVCEELTSFFPEEVEAEPAPSPMPKRVETKLPKPSNERDLSTRRARARERERLAMR